MIGLIQRVTQGSVSINNTVTGKIGVGLVALIGVEKGDGNAQSDRLLERILGYRVFPDETDRMNRSLRDINGGLLLIPQFTLPADTRKGTRPSFSRCADPDTGRTQFEYLLQQAKSAHPTVTSGQFQTDMQVNLTNDGPVTFWLQT